MSDTTAEVKDSKTTPSPVKKPVETKVVEAEANGESKEETKDKKNGVERKDEKSAKGEPLENGCETKEEEVVTTQKRKSEADGGDATDSGVPTEVSPEKKAKLEEKVENGEAEATA